MSSLLNLPLVVVALALALGHPIWTNDRDFDNLPGIATVSTAELLAQLP